MKINRQQVIHERKVGGTKRVNVGEEQIQEGALDSKGRKEEKARKNRS